MIKMRKSLWRLRGMTDNIVECRVEPTPARVHAVTVVLGAETFLNECYPDAASAVRRAMQVRDDLLKSGSWTAADSPVTRPTLESASGA